MKVIFFVVAQLIFNLTAYSNDVLIKLLEKEQILRRGKITKAVFITKNNKFINEIKANSSNKSLNEWLYLYSVEFVQESDNGQTQIGANVVLKKLPSQKEISIKLNKDEYILSLAEIAFNTDDATLNPSKSFFDEKYDFKRFWLWFKANIKTILLILIVFFVFSTFLLLKIQKRRKDNLKKKQKKHYWLEKIKTSQTRKELEEIYQKKTEWCDFFLQPLAIQSRDSFFKNLEDIQYLKEWSMEEQEKIIKDFENMKKNIS